MNEATLPTHGDTHSSEKEEASVSLIDILTWAGEGKRVIASATLIAAAGSLALALLLPEIFTARTTLLPAGSQQQSGSAAALASLGSLGGLAGGIVQKSPDELYAKLLTSDSVLHPLSEQFSLKDRYKVTTFEVLRKVMPNYVRISTDKKSGLITLEVNDEDPKFAAALANAHATEVSKLLSRLAISEAQQRRVFFEKQLKETQENLINAEQTLRQVQEKSGMVMLDKQAEAIIKSVAELRAHIVEREVRLKVLRTSTTPQNPDVQRMSAELSALRAELARMESANQKTDPDKMSLDIPVSKLPAASVEHVRALREVKFHEAMLGSMLRQFEIAKLDEAKDTPVLQQVDVAEPPDRKSKPSRALIVLGGTFLSFFLASTFVLLRRYLRASVEIYPERAQAWSAMRRAWKIRG